MDLSRFCPPSLLDQNFGLCINPEDLIFPSYDFHRTNYYRPWKWYMQSAEKDFGSTIENKKEIFKIALDVQHFLPEEINVKVAERKVIIEGKHEERRDNHGLISRQFKRRYILPHNCDVDTVFSSLSSDGVLTITANKIKEIKSKEITVPIKICDSYQNKALKTEIDINEKVVDVQKTDCVGKKGMELMLKEDSCSLRPELLGTTSSADKIQTKKELDNITKTTAETCAQAACMKMSEKMDAACGLSSSTKEEKTKTCGLTNTETTETIASGLTTASKTAVACGLTNAGITDKIATDKTSSGFKETAATEMKSAEKFTFDVTSTGNTDAVATGIKSVAKMDIAETLLSGLSGTEKAASLFSGLSSAGTIEQTESVACGITSEVLAEKSETSRAAMSEKTNITNMINETVQIESTSYSSSMATSIKETTEKISGIVSDISAQLKEAAENI